MHTCPNCGLDFEKLPVTATADEREDGAPLTRELRPVDDEVDQALLRIRDRQRAIGSPYALIVA